MAERKCDYKPLVDVSDGRAVCPPNLNKVYKLKGNCEGCPKVKGLDHLFTREPTNLGDQVARQIIRNQMYRR